MPFMKRVMDIAPIIPKDKNDQFDAAAQWSPFALSVHEPGVLRMITTVVVEAGSIISAGENAPPVCPVPALIFETNPDAVQRQRSFLWLAPGVKLTYPGKLEYAGNYIDERTRNLMFLYEVLSTDRKGA